ncbi:hypothetical protein NQ318_001403 [Aromia moschata]|uniref:Multidrug resistance-associated protein lethal(2)03659 n=1 Tax=Aromia moschata TaxID=1265417 RepID=A0AAV8YU81_9CUCU|nr:hypothetical protein NQ318_001403 [Aromia moschata]
MHPREQANVLSSLFFCWIIPTFIKGYKKDLCEEDLYGPLKSHESGTLGDKLEEAWFAECQAKNKPSLIKCIWKVFKWEIILNGWLLFMIELGVKLAQPICLAKLMEFYIPNQSSVTKKEATIYASVIVLATFFNVLLGHHYMLGNQHLGMKTRVACCSLIYRKSMRLSKSALVNTTIGQMINLLSNDVNRFDTTFMHFHNFWAAPIQIIVITSLIYVMLGVYALAGIGFFLIFIPLQMFLGKKASKYRMRIAMKTDERVRLMNEIICGIQVIKMYTWEKSFAKLVEKARKLEVREIRATSFIRAIHSSLAMFLNRTAIFFSILVYIFSGYTPHAYYVFVVTAFFNVVRQSMVVHVPHVISSLAEASVSIKRIEDFLLREEISQIRPGKSVRGISMVNKKYSAVSIQDISAKWDVSNDDNTLSDLNFEVGSNELVAVIGTVGSGKTSLFHVILSELPVSKGYLHVNGIVSYASQEPWIFPGTIKDNILFGQDMDAGKYARVCQVCALERDFSMLPYGDESIVGERGVLLSGGQKARVNLARAIYKDADVYLLDDPLSAVDTEVGKQLFDNCILDYLRNKCVVLVTHQLQYLRMVDRIYILKRGRIEISGTFEQLYELGNEDLRTILLEHQDDDRSPGESRDTEKLNALKTPSEMKEYRHTGAIEKRVYRKYVKAGGGYFMGFLVIMLFIITQFSASFADYLLAYWVNLEQKKSASLNENTAVVHINIFGKTMNCVYFYTSLICFIIVVALIRSMTFMDFCMVASRNLHNKMFSSIVHTTMRFFNVNPSGRILNRFSKDMGSIDEVLPLGYSGYVTDLFERYVHNNTSRSSQSVVLNPIRCYTHNILPTEAVFFGEQSQYKENGSNMYARSPVFSQMSTSMQGLTTIRAFGVQENLKRVFDSHQNLHSSAFYMFLICNRAFGFWLDLHCVVYVGLVTMGFLMVSNESYGGNVGLAITQSLSLTGMFQWGMRQWSELENQMTSVERVLEYADLKPELDVQHENVSDDWPESGEVRFEDVSLKYSPEEPFVLNKVNFTAKPTEKIGIVGRTGAGKSSLIAALFRLAETEGKVVIDGVDTKTVPLQDVRSKISIIPQEPVLFSGTLRRNLDPFDLYDDGQLWNALREVELEELARELPLGLYSRVSEGGSNFSVGQRQLLCLARAIIRNNNILVLDEATANVDHETDGLIQRTIREKFRRCTVLTIAHRLNTIMDSDKILVMEAGSAVEFDHPHNLLQDKESAFNRLVNQTGKRMSQVLRRLAEKSYDYKTQEKS